MTKTDGFDETKLYRKELPIEIILSGQITRIAVYRDTNTRQYASSIDTLILLCPEIIRKEAIDKRITLGLEQCSYENISTERMKLYDNLWAFINNELEVRNLIYKKSRYEVGHD